MDCNDAGLWQVLAPYAFGRRGSKCLPDSGRATRMRTGFLAVAKILARRGGWKLPRRNLNARAWNWIGRESVGEVTSRDIPKRNNGAFAAFAERSGKQFVNNKNSGTLPTNIVCFSRERVVEW